MTLQPTPPVSALINQLAECQAILDEARRDGATDDRREAAKIARVKKRQLLAIPAIRGALARLAEGVYCDDSGRLWTVEYCGLIAFRRSLYLTSADFDGPSSKHTGARVPAATMVFAEVI